MNPALIEQIAIAFEQLSGADFAQMAEAIRDPGAMNSLQSAEDIANTVAVFLPEAKYAADALAVLMIVVKLREAGVWAPADDPASLNRRNQPTSAG